MTIPSGCAPITCTDVYLFKSSSLKDGLFAYMCVCVNSDSIMYVVYHELWTLAPDQGVYVSPSRQPWPCWPEVLPDVRRQWPARPIRSTSGLGPSLPPSALPASPQTGCERSGWHTSASPPSAPHLELITEETVRENWGVGGLSACVCFVWEGVYIS